MRNEGGLDQGGSRGGSEKWLDSRHTLKVQHEDFFINQMWCMERRERSQELHQDFCFEHLEG